MKNPGAVVYNWRIAQEKLDEALDKKDENFEETIQKPKILPTGEKVWDFK